tara:strand:+ start:2771 stop:3742 length:972 start_codon:yes stop_codon:yes gene_type:complete
MKKITYYIVFSLISISSLASEQEQPSKNIDHYHNKISTYINENTEYIDEIIAKNEETNKEKNKSYAVLNIRQSFNSLYSNNNDIEFKFKAHLPYIKKRWNLFIDTNDSDFLPLEDKTKESFVDENSFIDRTKSSIVGLAFEDFNKNWNKKYGFGVKLDFPVDPFFKVKFYNKKNLSQNLIQDFNQEFFIYEKKGFGAKSNLNYIIRKKNKKYESNTYIQYLEKRSNEIEFSQQFSKWKKISQKATLKNTVGFSIIWEKHKMNNSYWVNTRYRRLLYSDWLYGKVIPEISFSRSYNYKPNYGILFQLELFFAKDNHIKEASSKD